MDHVTSLIGPSGCGKSTFLRTLNRMNDTIPIARTEGDIRLDGEDIYSTDMDVVQLRARVGMVFQKPNPFPKSIYDNVAYGLRIAGISKRSLIDEAVEKAFSLTDAESALIADLLDVVYRDGGKEGNEKRGRLLAAPAGG